MVWGRGCDRGSNFWVIIGMEMKNKFDYIRDNLNASNRNQPT